MSNKFDYILSPDGELYHWEKKDHKYISREKKNGKWTYEYPSENKGGRNASREYLAETSYNSGSGTPRVRTGSGQPSATNKDSRTTKKDGSTPYNKKSSGSTNNKIDTTIANIKKIAETVSKAKKTDPSDKSERSNGIDALLKEIDTLSTELKNKQSRSASDKSARVDKEADIDEIDRQRGNSPILRGQETKKGRENAKDERFKPGDYHKHIKVADRLEMYAPNAGRVIAYDRTPRAEEEKGSDSGDKSIRREELVETGWEWLNNLFDKKEDWISPRRIWNGEYKP